MNAGTADNPFPNLQQSGSDYVDHPLARHLHLSVSGHDNTAGSCQPSMEIDLWGEIIIGVKYHINIWFNESLVLFSIGHYSNYTQNPSSWPELQQAFIREAETGEEYIGHDMPVWWMSDKTQEPLYNRGNGTFSDITIISRRWTTMMPTADPTTAYPSDEPSYSPTIEPTVYEEGEEPSPPGTDIEVEEEDKEEDEGAGFDQNYMGIMILGGICVLCCCGICGIKKLYRRTVNKYEEHSVTEECEQVYDVTTTTGLTGIDHNIGTKSNENLSNEDDQTPMGIQQEIGRGITDLQEEDDSEDKVDEQSQLNDSKYE